MNREGEGSWLPLSPHQQPSWACRTGRQSTLQPPVGSGERLPRGHLLPMGPSPSGIPAMGAQGDLVAVLTRNRETGVAD